MITLLMVNGTDVINARTSEAMNYGVIGALGEFDTDYQVFKVGKADGSTAVEDIVVVAPLYLDEKSIKTNSFGYGASDTIASGEFVRIIRKGVFAFPTALLSSTPTWSSVSAGTYVTVNANGRLTTAGAADAGTVNVGKVRGLTVDGDVIIEIL